MASLASVGGVLAGGGISAVLAIAVTGFLLKRLLFVIGPIMGEVCGGVLTAGITGIKGAVPQG